MNRFADSSSWMHTTKYLFSEVGVDFTGFDGTTLFGFHPHSQADDVIDQYPVACFTCFVTCLSSFFHSVAGASIQRVFSAGSARLKMPTTSPC